MIDRNAFVLQKVKHTDKNATQKILVVNITRFNEKKNVVTEHYLLVTGDQNISFAQNIWLKILIL